jgi:hypothetical protein
MRLVVALLGVLGWIYSLDCTFIEFVGANVARERRRVGSCDRRQVPVVGVAGGGAPRKRKQ